MAAVFSWITPDARKACWHFSGLFTSSRHIPCVEFAGITHPGLIGCLPSRELLDTWNKRESALFATDLSACRRWRVCRSRKPRILTMKPAAAKKAALEAVRHRSAARTWRQLRHQNLSRGSKIFFPVYVKGGPFDGDIHFSLARRRAEITFCGAIEMAGFLDLPRFAHQGRHEEVWDSQPDLPAQPGRAESTPTIIFEGISVDEKASNTTWTPPSRIGRRA